jgi:undecaprenyl diphosphate synthase
MKQHLQGIDKLPDHLAVIMDGNGRWARARNLPRREGHRAGIEAARRLVTNCAEIGLTHLTVYTFSKENWARPETEVRFLFDLLVDFLTKETDRLLMKNNVRLHVLGETAPLPLAARKALGHALKKSAANTGLTLNLALNYSGRDEIVRAARKIVHDGLEAEEIDQDAVSARLDTAGQPDPDLIIRTSGEHRLSGYLLFQAAYAELHFTDTLWPDFDDRHLAAALQDFARRTRRFGRTGEQLDEPDQPG